MAYSVAVAYLAFSLLWIVGSDSVVQSLTRSIPLFSLLQTAKGCLFVFSTSILLFFVVRWHQQRVQAAHKVVVNRSLELAHRLARAIELRDVHTSQHNERIGRYCEVLAREMGLEDERVCRLVRVAPLHDVGKIAISDEILQKPGCLDTSEMEVVRRHARLGAELLRTDGDPLMDLAATVALTHHEAWDGTGYPNALRGEEIPLEGRIVAVCDVFDALVSVRPYKPAWTFQEAVAEISRLKGTRFDPCVVDAFERALPAMESAFHGTLENPEPLRLASSPA